ncbi:MAG: hypothetical protein DYG94_12325 [Leptolyngbya sp. PLA3]|nr:MAG: hypothetical protein EDM82_12820 [Cyanobacteria bacterium CYA]MCE7969511.1 hypothetical protein [Leptolyngbya sp. PL-A3]
MSQSARSTRSRVTRLGRLGLRAALAAGGAVGLTGCTNWDSYFDPSVTGRWEHTTTRVPVLERIATIEDEPDEFVEYSDIRPIDLIPEAEAYRLGAGDTLIISVYDLIVPGTPQTERRIIDQTGYIEFPQLGRFYVSGLTEDEVRQMFERRAADFVDNPLVSVTLESRRQQAFHLTGSVREPGPYGIPASDYRLLEALIAAGGIGESAKYVHVIRQVPLRADVRGQAPAELPADKPTETPSGEDLLNIIDDLSGQGGQAKPTGDGSLPTLPAERLDQPESEGQPEPFIDILETPPQKPEGQPEPSGAGGASRWVFLNGQWVLGSGPTRVGAPSTGNGGDDYLAMAGQMVTQRVIRVPVKPLLAGDARYNIVVRPGDIIRVPFADTGNVYIDGEVNRPGVYALPSTGRLTLMRAVTAAGGLAGIAIPERVDLVRMVGDDVQAMVMLDLRAITEGTQPDVYLKPDDRINVGTNFWAYPLAVVRNGFRASYGFGFLLDRNFGNDVFGPPPVSRGGGFGF